MKPKFILPNTFWVKINDSFGFIGVEEVLDSMIYIKNYTVDYLKLLYQYDNDDVSITTYLAKNGYDQTGFKSNGDVHAYQFELKKS